MTIRLQNLLVIPPIFLILALAVGFLADRAAQGEILWGLEEEAVAAAVTIAEMIGGEDLDRLAAGDTLTARRITTDLAEVARYGQVESVVVFSQVSGGTVLALHGDSAAAAEEGSLWTGPALRLRSPEVLGPPGPWGPYAEVMVAAAPIFQEDSGAEPRGFVAAAIDASRYSAVTRELRRDFLALMIVVTLIGVAAALFLSVRIGRQVRELGRLGAAVASGEYRVQVQVTGVKEVQDLSNTLGTMASILSDVLTRGRRALLVGDPFQLAQGMPFSYREARALRLDPPEGLEVGVSFIGKVRPGCFHGWAETDREVVLWVGEVREDVAEPLDVAIEAAAANRALRSGVQAGRSPEIPEEIDRVFHLETLQVARYERPHGPLRTRTVTGTGEPLEKGGHHALSSFGKEAMEDLSGALSLFKDLPANEVAEQIPLAFPLHTSGVILLIRPSGRSTEEGLP